MQYLLTPDEYGALKGANEEYRKTVRAVLQDLCIRVATHEPIKMAWAPSLEPSPNGCILKESPDGARAEYCDDCPVCRVCPHDMKAWSK